jgi:hypothetical protein
LSPRKCRRSCGQSYPSARTLARRPGRCAECWDERLTSGLRQVTSGGFMHKLSLFLIAGLLAACATEETKPTASSVPKRDLTLSGQSAQVEVASPIELRRGIHQTATHELRRMRQPAPQYEPTIIPAILHTTTATATAALPTEPAAEPSTDVSQPADPHELLPGKTITIIPVSNAPSIEGSRGDQPRTSTGHMGGRIGGGHGGGCRGHGASGRGSVPPAVLR